MALDRDSQDRIVRAFEHVATVLGYGAGEFRGVVERCQTAADLLHQPHVRLRPRLSIDGDQWCALYGEDLQDGVAGFGSSPEEAMKDFDRAYAESLPRRYQPPRHADAPSHGASDIEQASAHLRKARAAFVEAGRENDAESVLEAIHKVEGLRQKVGQ